MSRKQWFGIFARSGVMLLSMFLLSRTVAAQSIDTLEVLIIDFM